MPELDRLFLTSASEHHHSFELLYVGLLQVFLMKEIYEETLYSLMCVTRFKLLSLEDQYRLHILVNMPRSFELGTRFEICDTKFEHVENMTIKNTPKYQVVGSLFLMATHSE